MKRKLLAALSIGLMSLSAVAAAQTAPLTNDDVLNMVKQHKSDAEIINAINTSAVKFDFNIQIMQDLQKAGADPAVMQAYSRRAAQAMMAARLGGANPGNPLPPPSGTNVTPPPAGTPPGKTGNPFPTQMLSSMTMTDDQMKVQGDVVKDKMARNGCFGPNGPRVFFQGEHYLMCQGMGVNMGGISSAKTQGDNGGTLGSALALPGEHSMTVLPSNVILQFTYGSAGVAGVAIHQFQPVLVKVAHSPNRRVVARTVMTLQGFPPKKELTIDEDVVPVNLSSKNPLGLHPLSNVDETIEMHPLAPLPPGEYAVVLRRNNSGHSQLDDATGNDIKVVPVAWDFSVK